MPDFELQLPAGLWSVHEPWFARAQGQLAATTPEAIDRVALSHSDDEQPTYERSGQAAVIPVRGVLTKESSWWSWLFGGTSTQDLCQALRKADAELPANAAILLVFDSPGGTVDGTAEAGDCIARIAAKRPVYAYVEDMCCSAAYWLASQCGSITANQTCMVGSIGVLAVVRDSSDLYERMGMKVHAVGTAPHKGAGTPGTKVTKEHLAEFKRNIESVFDSFKGAVKRGRKMSDEQLEKVADARVHIGSEGVALGLIDGVAPYAQVLADVSQGRAPSKTAKSGERKATMSLKAALAAAKAAYFAGGGQANAEDAPVVAALEGGPTPHVFTGVQPNAQIEALTAQVTSLAATVTKQNDLLGKQTEALATIQTTNAAEIAALKEANAKTQQSERDGRLRQRVEDCKIIRRNMTSAESEFWHSMVTPGNANYNPAALEAALPGLESRTALPRLLPASERAQRVGPTQLESPIEGSTGDQLIELSTKLAKEKGISKSEAMVLVASDPKNYEIAKQHHIDGRSGPQEGQR